MNTLKQILQSSVCVIVVYLMFPHFIGWMVSAPFRFRTTIMYDVIDFFADIMYP